MTRTTFFSIVLFFSLLLSLPSRSQKYTPFDFENGIWIVDFYAYDEPYSTLYHNQYFSNGDTTINNNEYYKLITYEKWTDISGYPTEKSSRYYVGAIRNVDKKVEIIFWFDSIPRVLYDFELDIGDTIKNGLGKDENVVITDVDSILICGQYRKTYNTNKPYLFDQRAMKLIEGIGYEAGFIRPWFDPFETSSHLVCYTERNNSICDDCKLLLHKKEHELEKEPILKIYQSSNNITINSSKNIEYVKIYSYNGILLEEINASRQSSIQILISVSLMKKKMIVLKIEFQDQSTVTKKLILKE